MLGRWHFTKFLYLDSEGRSLRNNTNYLKYIINLSKALGYKWILLNAIQVVDRLIDVFSQSLSLFYRVSIQVTLSIVCILGALFKNSRFPLIKEWKEKKEEESGTLFIFQIKICTLHQNHLEVLLDHRLLGLYQISDSVGFRWSQILWILNKFPGNANTLFWRSHFENHCKNIMEDKWKFSTRCDGPMVKYNGVFRNSKYWELTTSFLF